MFRTTVVSIVPLLWAAAGFAQTCNARFEPQPDAKWSLVTADPATRTGAPLRLLTHLRCLGCTPEVSIELSAGPASPALQNMSIGQKVGLDWARAVVDDPAAREGFRQSVLRSEIRSSPGCSLQGNVTGAQTVGNLGTVGTAIEAVCAQGTVKLLGEFYSAYDYTCQYQVQVVWNAAPLTPETRADVVTVLRNVRFGQ